MLKEQHIQNSKNMITNYATNHAHQRVVLTIPENSVNSYHTYI